MPDGTYRRLTEAVLIAHQRRADSNCLCGRLRLGQSWAVHVTHLLAEVGSLRARPPKHRSWPQPECDAIFRLPDGTVLNCTNGDPHVGLWHYSDEAADLFYIEWVDAAPFADHAVIPASEGDK